MNLQRVSNLRNIKKEHNNVESPVKHQANPLANNESEIEQNLSSSHANPQFRLWELIAKFSDEIKELAGATPDKPRLFGTVKRKFENLRDNLRSTEPEFEVGKSSSEDGTVEFSLVDTPEDARPSTFFSVNKVDNRRYVVYKARRGVNQRSPAPWTSRFRSTYGSH